MTERIPLALDYVLGRRMRRIANGETVIYCGRSSTGNFVFERPNREFIALWPFQVRVPDRPIHPSFDEAAWIAAKKDAEDKAWAKRIADKEAKINIAIAKSRVWWRPPENDLVLKLRA